MAILLASAENVLYCLQTTVEADVICPDTYGSIIRANRYFDNRLRNVYWTRSTNDKKKAALTEATRIIDCLNYAGVKTDPTQLHQFPRSGNTTVLPAQELTTTVDATVPVDIEVATYEIAIQLLSGVDPDLESDNLAIHSQGISTARSTYERGYALEHIVAGVPSARAWKLLYPYLRDPKRITLCRVN